MKTFAISRYALSISVAASLAACGGSQPPIGAPGAIPPSRAAAMRGDRYRPALRAGASGPEYKTNGPLLYATNFENLTYWEGVTVYPARAKDPAPVAKISDSLSFPVGVCIDEQGTLYVTNSPNSGGWVSEFPLGKMKPSTIITDGIRNPGYCAIDAKGNLWLTNAGANVTEYIKGTKKPHTVITKGLAAAAGIAIDHSGNLYVSNHLTEYSGDVVVYAPGKKSPSRTITNGIGFPMGLAVDSHGTLYVADIFQNNVEEYRSGQNDPFQKITEAMSHPTGVTVDKNGVLYVDDGGDYTVVEFAPGSLKPLKRQINKALFSSYAIAHYPALLP
jgi:sugar lactone lactonase YvrE